MTKPISHCLHGADDLENRCLKPDQLLERRHCLGSWGSFRGGVQPHLDLDKLSDYSTIELHFQIELITVSRDD